MARGTLQMAWINKGDGSQPQYHVMYGVEGENRTMRARTVKGDANLANLLQSDLKVVAERVSRALDELRDSGQSSVAGMDVPDTDLQRLELA